MIPMLHTLTTGASGTKAQHCVLTRIARFAEIQTSLVASVVVHEGTTTLHRHQDRAKSAQAEESPIDLSLLISHLRSLLSKPVIARQQQRRQRRPPPMSVLFVLFTGSPERDADYTRARSCARHHSLRMLSAHAIGQSPTKAAQGLDREGWQRAAQTQAPS